MSVTRDSEQQGRAPDPALIQRAVGVLARGGLVALPTETVYGLAADAHNEAAVRAVFAAKGRPVDHPLIVHVASAAEPDAPLDVWSAAPTPAARALARAFWPGPLTLVLPRSPWVLDAVTGGQETVALRCPAHPWAQALLGAYAAQCGHALVAPSANAFGRISPTTAAHVRADLGEKPQGLVDLILDGGPCAVGIESTIVDCRGPRVCVLRPGAIARDALAAVLGYLPGDADARAPRVSGRLPAHYAPRTALELIGEAQLDERLAQLAEESVAILGPAPARPYPAHVLAHIPAAQEAADYARALYGALHALDASGAQRLLIVRPPQGGAWEAIHDRLARAAAGGGVYALEGGRHDAPDLNG